ncbi:hypothetical protein Zmor_027633 [Zophobas morio]|uniref:Xaa-Pro dipeptidase n=1 Tax=Zophobas morio TaxID=2755281 RepID=A0AA38HTU5_9CUCU|nr:hypothetical protein Zmor_027633 [Zophobas morio]
MVEPPRRKFVPPGSATTLTTRTSKTGTALPAAVKHGRLSNGPGTHEIPVELFANNRTRLIEQLRPKITGKPVVLLQGGDEVPLYDTDNLYAPFRQESFFMWTFGVVEPGCYGAIDIQTKTNYLFVPRYPDSYRIWNGHLPSPAHLIKKYGLHQVNYVDELLPVLLKMTPTVLLTLRGVNSDSSVTSKEARFPGIDKFQVNNAILYPEIADLRVFKNDYEIDVLRYVVEVTSEAMRSVMRFARPGKTDRQCVAEFLRYSSVEGGCEPAATMCTCAAGENAAFVNYGGTADVVLLPPDGLCVLDMGACYFGYCGKISCTFPLGGKFGTRQKLIYEAVLAARDAVFKELRSGVEWTDMQLLSQRTLLGELKTAGLLRGDLDQMVNSGLGVIFHPHGIGSFLGLDEHDVGGFIGAKPAEGRAVNVLRTTRVLEERMVLTLGPGCYFNDMLLDEAAENASLNRFFVTEILRKFRGLGGVKIQDDVLITKNKAICLTKLPRTVTEIENWLAGKDDTKYYN